MGALTVSVQYKMTNELTITYGGCLQSHDGPAVCILTNGLTNSYSTALAFDIISINSRSVAYGLYLVSRTANRGGGNTIKAITKLKLRNFDYSL